MSLARTGLRVAIRSLAPPAVLIYIFYRFYQKLAPMPWFKNLVDTYRRLFRNIKYKVKETNVK